jgi:hypothetical protein
MTNIKNPIYVDGDSELNSGNDEASWIQTFSCRKFNPLDPNPESIVIQDIAHALSMQCRFSGHVKEFYSVAQHSVGVSYLTAPEDALWGLLHDASEAYLVDIPSPLKKSGKFDPYLDFERNMMAAVCKRFNLSLEEPPSVKKADRNMLVIEAEQLMSPLHPDWKYHDSAPPFKVLSLSPKDAKKMFLRRFAELTDQPIDIYNEYY